MDIIYAKDADGHSALIESSSRGYLEQVQLLLDKGADVNIRDKDGNTALIHASSKGHLAIVKLLIEKVADINAKNNDGKTALIVSINVHLEWPFSLLYLILGLIVFILILYYLKNNID